MGLTALRTAFAAAAIRPASGARSFGRSRLAPGLPPSVQAVSAGSSSETGPGTGPKLASQASAARLPASATLSADLIQTEFGPARPRMFEVSGAS